METRRSVNARLTFVVVVRSGKAPPLRTLDDETEVGWTSGMEGDDACTLDAGKLAVAMLASFVKWTAVTNRMPWQAVLGCLERSPA